METNCSYPPSSTLNIAVTPGQLVSFSNDDLDASDNIVITSLLDAVGANVTVIDGDGKVIQPDEITFSMVDSIKYVTLNLHTFTPLVGTWYVKLS